MFLTKKAFYLKMNQHQDYDKIIKETIEKIGTPILQKLLKIEATSIEDVPTTIPRTIERRADFLKIGVDSTDFIKKLFHLEFQANIHEKMLQRFLVYFALFYEKFGLPIKQYVIYLGTGTWTALTRLEMNNIVFEYEVININTIDYEVFIDSENPEEIMLAILADFKKQDKTKVIKRIITCLKDKTKNKKKLQKLIMQLEILSNLRNLQPEITKILTTMSITYDVTQDLRYLEGVEQNKKEMIVEMLLQGVLTLKQIADVAKIDIDTIIEISNELKSK